MTNYETILARVEDPAMRAAAGKCLEAPTKLNTRKATIYADRNLTDSGKREALRAAMLGYVRELRAAREPIDKAAKDAKAQRDALRDVTTDPRDLQGAIERMEIRNFVRGLSPGERHSLAMTTNDLKILESMITASPELSGLTGNQRELAEQIEQRYIALKHPDKLAEIEATERVVADALAVAQVARGQIRSAVEMDEREFEAIAGPVERKVGAPWLIKSGGQTLVCEVDANGKATYHPASQWELAEGLYHENHTAWLAARSAAA